MYTHVVMYGYQMLCAGMKCTAPTASFQRIRTLCAGLSRKTIKYDRFSVRTYNKYNNDRLLVKVLCIQKKIVIASKLKKIQFQNVF